MSRAEQTKRRILESTRTLLEKKRAPVSMSEIAAEAGVSRQLLYLHFDGISDLLLHLSRNLSSQNRTPEREAHIDSAPTAREALKRTVALEGLIRPALQEITMALDVIRHADPDAAAAWAERDEHRYQRNLVLAGRLREEGALRKEWNIHAAARIIWSATSQSAWSVLTVDGDWSPGEWTRYTTRLLELTLCRADI